MGILLMRRNPLASLQNQKEKGPGTTRAFCFQSGRSGREAVAGGALFLHHGGVLLRALVHRVDLLQPRRLLADGVAGEIGARLQRFEVVLKTLAIFMSKSQPGRLELGYSVEPEVAKVLSFLAPGGQQPDSIEQGQA